MNITIRSITIDDVPAVTVLSEQLGYNMSIENTALQIAEILNSPNDMACVAVMDNKVVGWIHVFYTLRIECPSYCEIGGLVVDEHHRSTGIGKMLIECIKPWCADKKCSVLKVRSNIKRNDAHRFYMQAGFTEVKQQKVFEIKL